MISNVWYEKLRHELRNKSEVESLMKNSLLSTNYVFSLSRGNQGNTL